MHISMTKNTEYKYKRVVNVTTHINSMRSSSCALSNGTGQEFGFALDGENG